MELTFQPGDATSWHYHPVQTLVTVKEGEITFTMESCDARTYRAGQSSRVTPAWSAAKVDSVSGLWRAARNQLGIPR